MKIRIHLQELPDHSNEFLHLDIQVILGLCGLLFQAQFYMSKKTKRQLKLFRQALFAKTAKKWKKKKRRKKKTRKKKN